MMKTGRDADLGGAAWFPTRQLSAFPESASLFAEQTLTAPAVWHLCAAYSTIAQPNRQRPNNVQIGQKSTLPTFVAHAKMSFSL
jgi:hypothetical protein